MYPVRKLFVSYATTGELISPMVEARDYVDDGRNTWCRLRLIAGRAGILAPLRSAPIAPRRVHPVSTRGFFLGPRSLTCS